MENKLHEIDRGRNDMHYTKESRTPYEQYEAGEEWIYVDLRDFFPDNEPYTISREEYYEKFLHPRHYIMGHYTRLNYEIKFNQEVGYEQADNG